MRPWCFRRQHPGATGWRATARLCWPEDAGPAHRQPDPSPRLRRPYLGKGQYDEPFEMHFQQRGEVPRISHHAPMRRTSHAGGADVTRLRSLEKTRKHPRLNVSLTKAATFTVLKGYLEMTEEPPPPPCGPRRKVMMSRRSAWTIWSTSCSPCRASRRRPLWISHLVDMPAMLGCWAGSTGALGERGRNRLHGSAQSAGARGIRISCARRLQPGLQRHPLHPGGAQDHRGSGASRGARRCLRCRMRGGDPPEHLARLTERFYRVDKVRSAPHRRVRLRPCHRQACPESSMPISISRAGSVRAAASLSHFPPAWCWWIIFCVNVL